MYEDFCFFSIFLLKFINYNGVRILSEKPDKKKLIALNLLVPSTEPKCLEILKTNVKVIYNKYNSNKLKTKIPTKGINE